jgi:hypothetical protein
MDDLNSRRRARINLREHWQFRLSRSVAVRFPGISCTAASGNSSMLVPVWFSAANPEQPLSPEADREIGAFVAGFMSCESSLS